MHSHHLEIAPAALRDLKGLPPRIQRAIVMHHLPIIRDQPYLSGKPLAGALQKERAYHFGRRPEYRIIYFVEGDLITVTLIGTREEIYKKAKKR